jgi:uncharacterized protein YbcI
MTETPAPQIQPLTGGRLNAAISTGIVQLHSDHYGKGPTKARTYSYEDLVVCLLRDIFTVAERTLIAAGNGDTVRGMRLTFQDAMSDQFKAIVEELTGRRVIGFFSQIDVAAEMALEGFVLERRPEEENGPDIG